VIIPSDEVRADPVHALSVTFITVPEPISLLKRRSIALESGPPGAPSEHAVDDQPLSLLAVTITTSFGESNVGVALAMRFRINVAAATTVIITTMNDDIFFMYWTTVVVGKTARIVLSNPKLFT
jgi:hypothetical protein